MGENKKADYGRKYEYAPVKVLLWNILKIKINR